MLLIYAGLMETIHLLNNLERIIESQVAQDRTNAQLRRILIGLIWEYQYNSKYLTAPSEGTTIEWFWADKRVSELDTDELIDAIECSHAYLKQQKEHQEEMRIFEVKQIQRQWEHDHKGLRGFLRDITGANDRKNY